MKTRILISLSLICCLWSLELRAQDMVIGEIRMFAGNFAPRGWAFCEGQLLPINQYQALFSIIGTTYGGDGRTTFALPDLRGRVPVQYGQGAGLSSYRWGEKFGEEFVSLQAGNLPQHTHPVNGVSASGTQATPEGNYPADTRTQDPEYAATGTRVPMHTGVVGANTTTNQAINNKQPTLGMHYIIALVGTFPSRN